MSKTPDPYHDRPEWSYSQMKHIIKSGIDYAVAYKQKMLPQPASKYIDIGELAHAEILGGGDSGRFVVKKYPNYLTKEARAWRDEQTVPILSEEEFEALSAITTAIKTHPLYSELLVGKGLENEKELYATVNGVKLRGKADAIMLQKNSVNRLCDLKTTAQFDDWKYKVFRNHYDLQAATYSVLSTDATLDAYYFVAETIPPYRTMVFHCSDEFIENGNRKLEQCIKEIKKFGNRELDFHLTKTFNETVELGDFSL